MKRIMSFILVLSFSAVKVFQIRSNNKNLKGENHMKIFLTLLCCLCLSFWSVPAFADCEQHDFGSSGIQYYIYSDGRTWNFTAGQDMTVATIETATRLAGSGVYALTIKVLINGEEKASWSQNVTTTYTTYTLVKDVSFDLTTGDTITYKISGGTSSTPGGAITGPNYVKLCPQTSTPTPTPTIAPSGSISGIVTDLQGNPIENQIVIAETQCDGSGYGASIPTNTDGTYFISSLPAGAYYVHAYPNLNYMKEWWDGGTGTADCSTATPVMVTLGVTSSGINFSLESSGAISGLVTDIQGNPIENQIVIVETHCDGSGYGASIPTNADGTYFISSLPAGNYYAHTYPNENYPEEWWDGGSGAADCYVALPITVTLGETVTGINFILGQSSSYLLWTR